MRGMRRAQAGYVELILLGVLWGSIGVIVKDVRVGSPAIAAFRTGIGCLVVVGYQALRGRLGELRLRQLRGLLVFDGLLLGLHWVLMFEAFKRLSIATAILIVFVGPVFVAAGAGRILGERVERRTIASLALSLGGMALIAAPAWRVQDPLGVAFARASALGFAGLLLAGKRLTTVYRPPAILAWQLGIGTLAVLPLAATTNLGGLGDAMPALIALGALHTAIAGFVYFGALTVVKAQHVGVLTYLEPATAVVYAWIFSNETPTIATLAGGLLILAGGLNIVLARPGTAGSPEEPVAPGPDITASLRP